MRRVTIALLAASVLLAGCGGDSGDDTPSHAKQQAAVDAGEKSPQDAAFEDFVREEGFASTDADVEAMVALAASICAAYDRDVSFVDIIKTAAEAGGYSSYEAGQINGAATTAYCPEHATP